MTHTADNDAGCYICQPENPDAAEEGCAACEQEFWATVYAAVQQVHPSPCELLTGDTPRCTCPIPPGEGHLEEPPHG